jgi:type II secretion system protein N
MLRWWMFAAYMLFAATLFVAFVAASFPYADTITLIVAPMGLKVVFRAQGMSFPIGARLQDLQVISTATQPEELLFQSPDVTVAPGLALLLLGRPSLRIRALIYGGTVHAAVRQRAQVAGIDFELDSLRLAQSDLRHQLGAVLSGDVSANGSVEVRGIDLMADTGRMVLHGRGVTAAIVNGFPPLRFGAVTGEVLLNQGVVRLTKVQTHGADADIEASGEIQLAPDVTDSTVDVTISLAPTAIGRARFGVFLNMLPHPPSEGPYHVEGSLTSPSVS